MFLLQRTSLAMKRFSRVYDGSENLQFSTICESPTLPPCLAAKDSAFILQLNFEKTVPKGCDIFPDNTAIMISLHFKIPSVIYDATYLVGQSKIKQNNFYLRNYVLIFFRSVDKHNRLFFLNLFNKFFIRYVAVWFQLSKNRLEHWAVVEKKFSIVQLFHF